MLDLETQSNLGYRILSHLPWNSYTRKMIGYLYAIERGAELIYDTDDDNAPENILDFEKTFELKKVTRGLTPAGDRGLFENPYAHFGQGSIWPRGYPLDLIGRPYNNSYTVCRMATPLIQQGLVNGDPDVDAIFRLTRKNLYSPLNVQFDGSAPPIVFPKGLFAPFNSQNTIFHYDAFWSMLLPISVTFRVTDIWRGYWAQPLLWKVGGFLGFYSPHTTQIRNAHKYLRDFEEEDQLYKQSGNLIKQLQNWTCSQNLYGCMIDLTQAMVKWNMWSLKEVELVTAWIDDLKRIGYKPPKVLDSSPSNSPCLNGSNQSYAVFNGVENQPDSQPPKSSSERYQLKKFCDLSILLSILNPTKQITEPNIAKAASVTFPQHLLVVTFNFPVYNNSIWLLDLIYRPHFPNILYCGEINGSSTITNLTSSKTFVDTKVNKFSIVHANVTRGYFAYECAIRAIEMNYGVSGYIVLSDDVLLNFWNNDNFNPGEVWASYPFQSNLTFDISDPNFLNSTDATNWRWWKSKYGVSAANKALSTIYDSGNIAVNPELGLFTKNREIFGWNSSTVMRGASDLFYLPSSKQDVFYEVATILRKFGVFLEIALPLLISGLSTPKTHIVLPGTYLWYRPNERENPLATFSENISFIHPVKPSSMIKDMSLRMEYCSKYVNKVLSLH